MGNRNEDYDSAKFLAEYEAKKQRLHMRQAVGYTAGLVLVTGLLAIATIKILVPGLILSGTFYLGYRYGAEAKARVETWWNKRQARRQHGTQIDMQPLIQTAEKQYIARLVDEVIPQAMKEKSAKAANYESLHHLGENYVNTYYGYKHFKALTQYNLLRSTQNACLRGDTDFVKLMATERQARREKKIQILELFKAKLQAGEVSVNINYIPTRKEAVCSVAGLGKDAFLAAVAEINQSGDYPLIERPIDQTSLRLYVEHTLLPLVFDLHEVIKSVQSINAGQFINQSADKYLIQQSYPMSVEYVNTRLGVLRKSRQGELDQPVVEMAPVNEENRLDLVI